jgi:hypothetical protein
MQYFFQSYNFDAFVINNKIATELYLGADNGD